MRGSQETGVRGQESKVSSQKPEDLNRLHRQEQQGRPVTDIPEVDRSSFGG
jgi:hypothetical protein